MTAPTCPICGEPPMPEHHPFCSPRHRDRDLLQWLNGSYAIPAEPARDGLDKPDPSD